MPKPLSKRERSIRAKYRKLQNAEAAASAKYAERDRLAFQIAQLGGGHGKTVRIAEDRGVEIVDQYEAAKAKAANGEMPKAWAHGSVRQFDFKEVAVPAE